MVIELDTFVQRLVDSGLMSAAELASFQQALPPDKRPRDTKQLVTVLFHAGKLTKYQAKAIYEGKGKSLVFDEYVVLDQIGEGGMGVVVKAQHRRMKRMVAVKMLPEGKIEVALMARERFYHEVEAAAKLSHPNIVASYDAREHNGTLCLIMEYVDGHDLAAVIKEHGELPVAQAVDCIVQAARGLQFAHSKGIIHRDIKPANLLLDKEGVVKILDMGLARISDDSGIDEADRLTSAGQVMGTCDYMAPEQAFDIRHADHRADIYSLGCTLHRLLTRKPPYRSEILMQVLVAHRESPIPSLRTARPDVSEELDETFQRMLAKKPEDRYQSMAEVIAAMEAVTMAMSGKLVVADSPGEAFAKNWSFLQDASIPGAIITKKKSRALEATALYDHPEHDTARDKQKSDRSTLARIGSKRLVIAGLVSLVAILALGIVISALTLRKGTLAVDIDPQLAKYLRVDVSQAGQEIQQLDDKSGWQVGLSPGEYDLTLQVKMANIKRYKKSRSCGAIPSRCKLPRNRPRRRRRRATSRLPKRLPDNESRKANRYGYFATEASSSRHGRGSIAAQDAQQADRETAAFGGSRRADAGEGTQTGRYRARPRERRGSARGDFGKVRSSAG